MDLMRAESFCESLRVIRALLLQIMLLSFFTGELEMMPIAWAVALLVLICTPLILIVLRGLRIFSAPTAKRKQQFLVALLTVPLLVPAWIGANFVASFGWMPRPHLPDPGSGEAVMCAVLSIVLAYGCAAAIVHIFAVVRNRRRKVDLYHRLLEDPSDVDLLPRSRK